MRNVIRRLLVPIGCSLALSYLFWWPLWHGAGLIGGDLYPYYFPQKAFYSDCLKSGSFPLWNDLSGFGYPVLGESQTGAAHPLHYLFYSWFDLNTAYNIEHLLHYSICFLGTWLLASRLGLSTAGSGLAALVFTYGWFPSRGCLEWAILTGAWLPVALWCVESFLQTRLWRYAIGLSVSIGIQLLAGHYHLAFITLLLVVCYSSFRLCFNSRSATVSDDKPHRLSSGLALGLALLAGAGLAAVQLLPTWELKQRSTREIVNSDYDPAYGHMPPVYVSQAVFPWQWYSLQELDEVNLVREFAEFAAPWHWFGPQHDSKTGNRRYELDQEIQQARFGTLPAGTNKVEAHFYCGLIPVWMAILLTAFWIRRRLKASVGATTILEQTIGFWLVVSLLGLLYATGLLYPIGRHLPGFSFFRGPGRYGIVASLAIALFAGQLLSHLLSRISNRFVRVIITTLIIASTCGDLWLVSRMVKYTVMVSPPRIAFRDSSVVRQRLQTETEMPRLLAPGPNVGNLLGVSCVPWYMGIAPSEYVDPRFAMPRSPDPKAELIPFQATEELIDWLGKAGVTHVLSFGPIDERSWHVDLLWKGIDPFLNAVWARTAKDPIYLYRRSKQKSDKTPNFNRAYSQTEGMKADVPDWQHAQPNIRRLHVTAGQFESSDLVLTELNYPGWTARQGATELTIRSEGLFRAVKPLESDDEIVFSYQPQSFYRGALISLATALLLAVIAHLRFWHPAFVRRITNTMFSSRS